MEVKRKVGVKGKYKITVCEMPSDCAAKRDFLALHKAAVNKCEVAISRLHELFTSNVFEFENVVPDVYLESLAANVVTAGGSLAAADELRITYIAVGTGTTAVAGTDTTLETEVFRDTIDSQGDASKVARSTIFIGLSEANGNTLSEVGGFAGAASGVTDSGTMASHALLSPTIAKTITKTITIELALTFADV